MTEPIHFNFSNILHLDKRQRVNLINSCGGFKSVCMIGTISEDKQANLAIFSSIVHLGASPPLVAFVMRPDNDERHTLHNILSTGYYTINYINEAILMQAHQTSASYPREISEFEAVGLTPEGRDGFIAPFVHESNVKMGLQFKEKIDIILNGTSLIIGEIQHL